MNTPLEQSRGLTPGRLEALTDGVLAIVVTLLVLLLEPPPAHLTTQGLLAELYELWHMFVAYVVSFLLVALYWWRHHVMFHYLDRVDRTLTWLNLLFLLFVAFVPFPAALLIEYLNTPEAEIAVMLYGGVHVVCGLLLYAMWYHATRSAGLVGPSVPVRMVHRIREVILFTTLVYAVAMAVSFWSIGLALVLLLLSPLLHVLPRYAETHEVDLGGLARPASADAGG